jgi:branched-subunit amino acid aminotransferase/4-amino-4-deoxychorismate lyase
LKYPDFARMGRPKLDPATLYELSEKCFKNGRPLTFPFEVLLKDGDVMSEDIELAFKVSAGRGKTEKMDIFDFDAIIKILAFTNRLVSTDYFPPTIEMQEGGYVRPSGKMTGEAGQKIPTVFPKIIESGNGSLTAINEKPMEFSIAILSWMLYLNSEHYGRGLDILESPYRRSGRDLAQDAKVFFNYGISMSSINQAIVLGTDKKMPNFGEVASLNNKDEFVEGSAENVFVIMKEGNRYVAYTPPVEDGCLPGTTRDGLIKTLNDMDIEVRYGSLRIRDLKHAKGILLTGTGAQLIHVRSISQVDAAYKIARMERLDNERDINLSNDVYPSDFDVRTTLINNGEKHEIISRIQERHMRRHLDKPELLEPAHALIKEKIGKTFQVDPADFTTKQDRDDEAAGRFHVRTKNPDELRYLYYAKERQIRTAMNKSPKTGVREAAIFRRAA